MGISLSMIYPISSTVGFAIFDIDVDGQTDLFGACVMSSIFFDTTSNLQRIIVLFRESIAKRICELTAVDKKRIASVVNINNPT